MNRRHVLQMAAVAGSTTALLHASNAAGTQKFEHKPGIKPPRPGPFVVAKDGTRLYVQEWGTGRPVLLVSAWALSSDFWGTHMHALATAGFRAVAFDRRGHGRSDAPSFGYDADTLAQDLAEVVNTLDLRDVMLVAHSMGSGEAVRYMSSCDTGRISQIVLVAPTTPYLVRTADNPDAVPESILDATLATLATNFPKWLLDNEPPFFVAETDSATRAWIKAMMLGVPLPILAAFRQASGRTDFRADVSSLEVPALVLHGDRDASAPLALTGAKTAKLLRTGKLVVYENAPHALPLTHRERFLDDVLRFAKR